MNDHSGSDSKTAQSAPFDKYIVNKLLLTLHQCIHAAEAAALALQRDDIGKQDIFDEGLGGVLIEAISQATDRGLDAIEKLHEELKVNYSFPDLTPADRAQVMGYTRLATTLGGRDTPVCEDKPAHDEEAHP